MLIRSTTLTPEMHMKLEQKGIQDYTCTLFVFGLNTFDNLSGVLSSCANLFEIHELFVICKMTKRFWLSHVMRQPSREPSCEPLCPIAMTNWKGFTHLGCRLHASGICPLPCAYPYPKKSVARMHENANSVAPILYKKNLARIRFWNEAYAHPFLQSQDQKRQLEERLQAARWRRRARA